MGLQKRAREFSMPQYQLKHSDGRKLNVILKDVKGHGFTHFHTLSLEQNGLALKQGEEFSHSFNVKHIMYWEAKLTKGHVGHGSTRIIKRNCDSIFRDILKQQINKRRRKKENRRKSTERKRKRTENNVRRVYQGISVGNPLGNDPPQCLVYPPSLAAVPEGSIKVEDIQSHSYFIY